MSLTDSIRLADVLVPSGRPACGRPRRALEIPIGEKLRETVNALAIRAGADAPVVLRAAWAIVVARLTGASVVALKDVAGAGTRPGVCRIDVRDDAETGRYLTASAAARPVDESGDTDSAWAMDASLAATCLPETPLCFGADATRIVCNYDSVYDEPVVRRLIEWIEVAAHALAGQPPTGRLGEVQILGNAERTRLLHEWNETGVPRNPADSVDAIFRRAASQSPEAPAVVSAKRSLTYRELDRLSDAFAGHLASRDVAVGAVVAVVLDRSADAIVALLGILKAGAAYLPIEPEQPAARLRTILDDSQAALVLTRSEFVDRLPASGPAVLVLDEIGTWAKRRSRLRSAHDGESVAYVMYTSGSTGTPKGVAIPHRAIIRLVCGEQFVPLDRSTVMLHAAPLGFDASTLELWGPLLNGGRVVVYEDKLPTPAALGRIIHNHGITTAWLTSALFNTVVDDDSRHLRGLQYLLTGGEALSVKHVRRAVAELPDAVLINGYGPTECTTFAATHAVPRDLPGDIGSIPIGRPIANTSLYILNAKGQPVPTGVVGELYIGGDGVGHGYIGRPELNEERFLPNPFSDRQEPMYRTGDLARYLPDGNVEFVGRRDGQVKIRGFRIETGEVEAVLNGIDGVKASAVVASNNGDGNARLIAYVVNTDPDVSGVTLRSAASRLLPAFMVPAAFVKVRELPLTPNGKLDRNALPAPGRERPDLADPYQAPLNSAEKRVCDCFGAVLGIDPVGRRDNFFELGGSSLLALRVLSQLGEQGRQAVSVSLFFRDPTPAAIATALAQESDGSPGAWHMPGRLWKDDATRREPVAVIAMAGRFPGAGDVEAFWENLCAGREAITFFADEELDSSVPRELRTDPNYVKARGVIDGVELFDPAFFGINTREAELMDPQQRVFLELCWECLERAGYVPDATPCPVGVFAGMNNATYFQNHVSTRPDLVERAGAFPVMLANEKDYLAIRAAHRLNLTGPAISLNTACSTSLVAVCQAFESLRSGQCDMALAGGVSITCPPRSGYLYQEGAMFSPDGHTRTFDVGAKGTVFSDGGAVVLLKRLSDAIAGGDQIFAVVRGAAVNNDGATKASFTAPSVDGQANVVALAHDAAGVDARSISYVETHGTATPLGDPIEIAALTRAFRRRTSDVGFCSIGSLKTNVGHLTIAAGAAGVIKTALALRERRLPPSLHFTSANPKIDLATSPFRPQVQLDDWQDDGGPRRAGVSAFGVGGTNAHLVLEEAPAEIASAAAFGPQLVQLSARTPTARSAALERLAKHLRGHPSLNLSDVAYTLRIGRKAFEHRAAFVAESVEQAVAILESADPSRLVARSIGSRVPDVAFLFPGQGAQYPGMGRSLYEGSGAFRTAFDECTRVLRPELGFDLRDRVFADDPTALSQTSVTQPATFALEYSLARLWESFGVRPSALLGHSVGEFVCAVLAGVFALDDGLRLVARRAALMQAQPAGAMLSVRLGEADINSRLPAGVSLAAVNGPAACVVAGETEAIASLQQALEADGIAARLLNTSHAFHSAMMDAVLGPLEAEVRKVALGAPRVPVASTLTGEWLTDADATSPDYWTRHLRHTVQFSRAVRLLAATPERVLLELGPRQTLATLARQHLSRQAGPAAVSSLADSADSEKRSVLLAMGQLWCLGASIDLSTLDAREHPRRVLLPTYPFERKRCWVDPAPLRAAATLAPLATAAAPVGLAEDTMSVSPLHVSTRPVRRDRLVKQVRDLFEEVAGVDLTGAEPDVSFMELGLDSLALTQVALQLQKAFSVGITFRQLMTECGSLDTLADYIDSRKGPDTEPAGEQIVGAALPEAAPALRPDVAFASAAPPNGSDGWIRQVLQQQMQLMEQQLALLGRIPVPTAAAGAVLPARPPRVEPAPPSPAAESQAGERDDDEEGRAQRYDVKKAFGAIARIHTGRNVEISQKQRARLDAFVRRYVARTRASKEYTQRHRPHLADPRVVNGFRPALKEIVYQIVVDRSQGPYVWDIDGNRYVDALNGFGMSFFGWQPPFVMEAVRRQLEQGYEIGPQHALAGPVTQAICDLTGFDRAGLCNTGSEAVMGAVRIARTVTGRDKIALFSGSYHGIFDEVIVRGAKNLRAVPAAPGIMPNTAQNVLVLEYGAPQSLDIIRDHARDLAAVLVEPVQSRRPDFQPREFLQELRAITQNAGTVCIFDEIVTGFRAHPGGTQALFGIRADLATYGKVIGGGFPIGVIAGKREFMDALDGGHWEYGDESAPTVGVTYFAGTFVRHPMALAAADAVLRYLEAEGPSLQEGVNARTSDMVSEMNDYCAATGAPVVVKAFSSVWRINFTEEHPFQDLLFAMMRDRGIHILDNFPCFFTTAHTDADIAAISAAFKESIAELQEADFLPRHPPATNLDATRPPVPGARLGRDPDGTPAWFVPNPEAPGKYLKVNA